ncbi:glycosyl transferase [Spirosoma humi]
MKYFISSFKNSHTKKILYVFYIKYLTIRYGINARKIEKKIQKLNNYGTRKSNDNVMVSVTSYGERLNNIHLMLYSLLTQSFKPNRIILWLSKDEFPNLEKDLPSSLISLKAFGIEIEWCKDLRSYTKLVPALIKYPEYTLVTADDDVFYKNDWLEKLYYSFLKAPNYIHAHIATKITLNQFNYPIDYSCWKSSSQGSVTFKNFLKGVGGVLYPPNSLHQDTTRDDLFLKLSPSADDIWFWAMAILNGTKIKVVENNIIDCRYTDVEIVLGGLSKSLHEINVKERQNDSQIVNVMKYYPQIVNHLCES